jgi:hypothetical protein
MGRHRYKVSDGGGEIGHLSGKTDPVNDGGKDQGRQANPIGMGLVNKDML